ncbi:MAG: membrane protein involved in the export of O-antigen and teichoic acid [Bacteroidetes bacterium]|nr:MAG: membrane protein involved in the export of O-antigen and teichoic acid [Bacteroidota bacterium]
MMLRNILTNFFARFSVAAINFLVLLLTTNLLGLETKGEMSLVALGTSIIHLLSDIAGGPSVVYLVPRKPAVQLFSIGYAWSFFCVTVIGIPLVYFNLVSQQFGLHILLLSLLMSLHSVHLNYLLGLERIRLYSFLLLLQAVVLITAMSIYIFIFKGKGVAVFITGAYIAYGTVLAVGATLAWKHRLVELVEKSRDTFYLLFRNGFFTQVASLTHQLSIRINFYLIGGMAVVYYAGTHLYDGVQGVGIYSTAVSLAEAILLFSQSVATMILSRTANTEDRLLARRLTLQCSKLSLAITIPGLLLFLLLPAEFYTGLLGKDFSPVKDVFTPLAAGVAMVSFGTVFSHYFSGIGKHYMNALSGTFGLLITLSTAFWLIPRYGLEGASVAATLAYSGMSLFIFVMFIFEKGFPAKETIRSLFSLRDFSLLQEQWKKLRK